MNKKLLKVILPFLFCASLLMIYIFIINNPQYYLKRIIRNNKNSIVLLNIYNYNGDNIGSGSGFIYKNNIITNYHVIQDARYLEAKFNDGASQKLTLINNIDSANDIAVLNFDNKNIKGVTIGNSSAIQDGDAVVAIGCPSALQDTVSNGIISNTSRQIDNKNMIQFSAPISPGSSGGALFDKNGKVIGITTSGLDQGNIYFAIPINYLVPLLDKSSSTTFEIMWNQRIANLQNKIRNDNPEFHIIFNAMPSEKNEYAVFFNSSISGRYIKALSLSDFDKSIIENKFINAAEEIHTVIKDKDIQIDYFCKYQVTRKPKGYPEYALTYDHVTKTWTYSHLYAVFTYSSNESQPQIEWLD